MPCSIAAAAWRVVDAVGQLHEAIGGNRGLFGVGADDARPRDAVADAQTSVTPRTDRPHGSGALPARA